MIRGCFYRAIMRLLHKFNLHYAPTIGPFEDGTKQQWCKWCGMRDTIPAPDPWRAYTIGLSAAPALNFQVKNVGVPTL